MTESFSNSAFRSRLLECVRLTFNIIMKTVGSRPRPSFFPRHPRFFHPGMSFSSVSWQDDHSCTLLPLKVHLIRASSLTSEFSQSAGEQIFRFVPQQDDLPAMKRFLAHDGNKTGTPAWETELVIVCFYVSTFCGISVSFREIASNLHCHCPNLFSLRVSASSSGKSKDFLSRDISHRFRKLPCPCEITRLFIQGRALRATKNNFFGFMKEEERRMVRPARKWREISMTVANEILETWQASSVCFLLSLSLARTLPA